MLLLLLLLLVVLTSRKEVHQKKESIRFYIVITEETVTSKPCVRKAEDLHEFFFFFSLTLYKKHVRFHMLCGKIYRLSIQVSTSLVVEHWCCLLPFWRYTFAMTLYVVYSMIKKVNGCTTMKVFLNMHDPIIAIAAFLQRKEYCRSVVITSYFSLLLYYLCK